MPRRSSGSAAHAAIILDSSSSVFLLRGSPHEAPYISIGGKITTTGVDAATVKKVHVKLVGLLKIRWVEAKNPHTSSALPVSYDKVIYEQELSNFEFPRSLRNHSPKASPLSTPTSSMSSLTSYFANHSLRPLSRASSSTKVPALPKERPCEDRQASTQSVSDAASIRSGASRTSISEPGAGPESVFQESHSRAGVVSSKPNNVLEFPFEFKVPGDAPETIEGHEKVRLVYRLVATVERSWYLPTVTAKKHLRIARTLGIDTYDVAHTISIDNTWPKKVEYSIYVPSKAIPIGSSIETFFRLQPLDKGLTLGKVRCQLVETVHLFLPSGHSHVCDDIVCEEEYTTEEVDPAQDQWEFTKVLKTPYSLSNVTQGVHIGTIVKVGHKVKVSVSIRNRDGHISELRASLPLILFISPRVPVVMQDPAASGQETPVFTETHKVESPTEAPPNYSERVFDRLWSTPTSPLPSPSPADSGWQTPRYEHSLEAVGRMTSIQQAELTAGLQSLLQTREAGQDSPQIVTTSQLDLDALSRVPSYEHAYTEANDELAPSYH